MTPLVHNVIALTEWNVWHVYCSYIFKKISFNGGKTERRPVGCSPSIRGLSEHVMSDAQSLAQFF